MSVTSAQSSHSGRKGISEWLITILMLLWGTTAVCQPFVIPTGSMEDTLLVGDHLIVDKLAYSPAGSFARHLLPYETPQHGDIIVFRYPANPNTTLVKRLIGMPGDRIHISHGVVFRNGQALKEPYVVHKYGSELALDDFPNPCCRPVKEQAAIDAQATMLGDDVVSGDVVVPEGMYFAMGDNRDNSSDSRYWGFVPRDSIIGKPVLIYWSYQASTEDLSGETADSALHHVLDIGEHLFTRTRWRRTGQLVRGVPDSALRN